MNSIVIKDLKFSYADGTCALDTISLSIDQGESVGIVGANGAGKSTFVNHLNGYHLPQSGTISVGGMLLTKKTQEQIRKIVGIVFQNADDQLFTSRVYDDIAFGPQNLGLRGSQLQESVEKILKELTLWDLRDKPPSHLSAGQKRFCAFATILVMQPQIIVMDEPTSDLDPRHRRQLVHLVKSLDTTRITVSHDLDYIWETANRVVVMSEGKIVADGPTKEILTSQTLLESNGLELPLRLQR
jgi:cobalt/nickel transport system ATP-binding protein